MGSTAAKKAFELEIFKRAQRHVNAWFSGAIDDKGEAPDLVISTNQGTYGVEVTEVMRSDAKSSLEGRKVVCGMAKKQYLSHGGRDGLQVTAIFDDAVSITKRDYQESAAELVRIVLAEVPGGSAGAVRLRLARGLDFNSIRFTTVWLHDTPMIARSDWRTANAWWTPVLRASEIEAELERKEQRLPSYRRRADKVWLLLVADGFDGSNAGSIDTAVYGVRYATNFDGVVLYEQLADRATILDTFRAERLEAG